MANRNHNSISYKTEHAPELDRIMGIRSAERYQLCRADGRSPLAGVTRADAIASLPGELRVMATRLNQKELQVLLDAVEKARKGAK